MSGLIRTGALTQLVVDKYGGEDGAASLSKYIPLTQVASSTGGANSIADVLVLGAWKSSGNFLDGFEVKISRADWLNEVKNPEKCTQVKQYCDRWWLVIADASMVKEDELPEDWGMMIVEYSTGAPALKVVKKAPLLNPKPLSNDFVASLLRTDVRGKIPLDVHNDKMKDLKLEYDAAYKKKYEKLLTYVKELHKELGIEIKYDDYRTEWNAKIGSWGISRQLNTNSSYLSPAQLASAIKIVLSGDMENIKWKLESLNKTAEEIHKITKEFPKED